MTAGNGMPCENSSKFPESSKNIAVLSPESLLFVNTQKIFIR